MRVMCYSRLPCGFVSEKVKGAEEQVIQERDYKGRSKKDTNGRRREYEASTDNGSL